MTEREINTPSTFPPRDTVATSGVPRFPSSSVTGNGYTPRYQPDWRTRRIIRHLERKGLHLPADAVRSYREHPAKKKLRIRWGVVMAYTWAGLAAWGLLYPLRPDWYMYYFFGLLSTFIVFTLVTPKSRD